MKYFIFPFALSIKLFLNKLFYLAVLKIFKLIYDSIENIHRS